MISDYEMRKKFHYCVTCGKQDAYTLGGRARCYECNKKQNEYIKAHPEYSQKRKEKDKAKYLERKQQGLCVVCGKKAEKGRVRCAKHLYANRFAQKPKELNRIFASNYGICMTCLKAPSIQGHKLCESCYAKSLVSIENARKHIKNRIPLLFGKKLGQVIKKDETHYKRA